MKVAYLMVIDLETKDVKTQRLPQGECIPGLFETEARFWCHRLYSRREVTRQVLRPAKNQKPCSESQDEPGRQQQLYRLEPV
jgi:hypothetical protein